MEQDHSRKKEIILWTKTLSCVSLEWERAYASFETPQQEITKFRRRLNSVGAKRWNRNAMIIELFCGRGNGIRALEQLGFNNIYGVDLSYHLLATYEGEAQLFLGDCRDLKLSNNMVDYVVVQGGCHHLENMESDLNQTLREVNRILKEDGEFVLIEPWKTPFLKFMHILYNLSWLRKFWPKLDALATMTELEYPIYNTWIDHPHVILKLLQTYFEPISIKYRLGKLIFRGRKLSDSNFE